VKLSNGFGRSQLSMLSANLRHKQL